MTGDVANGNRAYSKNGKTAAPKFALAMRGGHGEDSYAKNSQAQAHIFGSLNSIMFKGIQSVTKLPSIPPGAPAFRIADLGCASGRNTVTAMDLVLRETQKWYASKMVDMPKEVEAFFADLPANDFNTLFQLYLPTLKHSSAAVAHVKPCFAAAVAGSFYGRLFPAKSMHVLMSSASLHWMSQIPEAVLDKKSPAYNKGRVWVQDAGLETALAYSQQSKTDLRNFLRCRAEELVPGGLLLLLFGGRVDPKPHCQLHAAVTGMPLLGDILNQAWKELVAEGMIKAEKRDAFNVPIFGRTLEEVREGIEEQEAFDIHLLEQFSAVPLFPASEEARFLNNPKAFGKFYAGLTRSTTSNLVESLINAEQANLLYARIERLAAENVASLYDKVKVVANVAVLVRK